MSHNPDHDSRIPEASRFSQAVAALGWTEARQQLLEQLLADPTDTRNAVREASLHRIVRHDRGGWTLVGDQGELLADVRGRLRLKSSTSEFPVVGDWVLATVRLDERKASIEAVLPRTTALQRKAAGTTSDAQTVAANVDTVLIVIPGDSPPNPRRVERELALVWESGAVPVVVVTKADLVVDPEDMAWLNDVAVGVDVAYVDSLHGDGLEQLANHLGAGSTLVLLGPSGAGKSTLVNGLVGEQRLATGMVDSDQRGRHTTTHRELVTLPSGAMIIDTPGIREVGLFGGGDDDALAATFDDVDAVIAECRFGDCAHEGEPGCAVRAALDDGTLSRERYDSWSKLQRELQFEARRHDARLAAEEKRKWAARSRDARSPRRP